MWLPPPTHPTHYPYISRCVIYVSWFYAPINNRGVVLQIRCTVTHSRNELVMTVLAKKPQNFMKEFFLVPPLEEFPCPPWITKNYPSHWPRAPTPLLTSMDWTTPGGTTCGCSRSGTRSGHRAGCLQDFRFCASGSGTFFPPLISFLFFFFWKLSISPI